MAGGALQEHPGFPGTPFPTRLHLFAGVLLIKGWDPADEAFAVVEEACARHGADPPLAALRSIYERLRGPAAALPRGSPPAADPRWRRAASALGALRHRQRAVLALFSCVGLDMDEVGAIVGVSAAGARRIAEAGVAAAARALGDQTDVRRALRDAGRRLVVPEAPPAPLRRHSPVEVLLAPNLARPTPFRVPARMWRRAMLAAALAIVVAAALLPVAASEWPPRAPSAVPAVDAPHDAEPAAVPALERTVTVRRGDSLWRIAARTLGDPGRWPEIWERNRARAMKGGERFTDPDLIRPGWALLLPRS